MGRDWPATYVKETFKQLVIERRGIFYIVKAEFEVLTDTGDGRPTNVTKFEEVQKFLTVAEAQDFLWAHPMEEKVLFDSFPPEPTEEEKIEIERKKELSKEALYREAAEKILAVAREAGIERYNEV